MRLTLSRASKRRPVAEEFVVDGVFAQWKQAHWSLLGSRVCVGLLGLEGSGKSTIFRQLKLIYSDGFSDVELHDLKKNLPRNSNNQSTNYFVTEAQRISAPGYVPTAGDLLRTKKPTSSQDYKTIVSVGSLELTICDIDVSITGGSINMHPDMMDNYTQIIFCVSLSDYDQPSDKFQSKLVEALAAFHNLADNYFYQNPIILVMTKFDEFARKLKHVPLEDYLPGYVASPNASDLTAARFIVQLFYPRGPPDRLTHIVVATDIVMVRTMFDSISENIISTLGVQRGVW